MTGWRISLQRNHRRDKQIIMSPMKDLSKVAAEILELESLAPKRRWTTVESERWSELVGYLLKGLEFSPEDRRNIRVPCSTKMTLEFGVTRVETVIKNVSHTGACFTTVGNPIRVEDVYSLSKINCNVRVIWVKARGNKKTFGVQFLPMSQPVRSLFMSSLYYPAYVFYLRQLSMGGTG
jgi:hypothetical protein